LPFIQNLRAFSCGTSHRNPNTNEDK
jgi:hypothetical protein